MRPVDLRPGDVAVVKTPGAGPSATTVGAAVIGGVAVLAVAGYFMMARVNSLKDDATASRTQAQQYTQEKQQVDQQIAEAGQSKTDDFDAIAASFEQDILSKMQARADYYSLLLELNNVRLPGSWFTSLSADAAEGDGDATPITLLGYVSDLRDLAGLVTRINSTESMDDATVVSMTNEQSAGGKTYVKFEISATVQMLGDTPGASGSGQLVGNDPNSDGSGGLALDPSPSAAAKKKKAKKPAKPANAFAAAASAAGGAQ